MSDFEPIDHEKSRIAYWTGRKNRIVRYWTYLERGFDLINKGRYFILAIFGVYIALKLINPLWLVLMFIVGIPVMILIGRYYLHRVVKVQEWVNVTFGSVLGFNQYNIEVRQMELLEKQVELLEKIEKKLDNHLSTGYNSISGVEQSGSSSGP